MHPVQFYIRGDRHRVSRFGAQKSADCPQTGFAVLVQESSAKQPYFYTCFEQLPLDGKTHNETFFRAFRTVCGARRRAFT
jgi:hypothetical protein